MLNKRTTAMVYRKSINVMMTTTTTTTVKGALCNDKRNKSGQISVIKSHKLTTTNEPTTFKPFFSEIILIDIVIWFRRPPLLSPFWSLSLCVLLRLFSFANTCVAISTLFIFSLFLFLGLWSSCVSLVWRVQVYIKTITIYTKIYLWQRRNDVKLASRLASMFVACYSKTSYIFFLLSSFCLLMFFNENNILVHFD